MFAGKSALRSNESKAPPLVNKELQDYLAKYTSSGAVDKQKKRKKKPKPVYAGVKVVDNDVSGFAPNIAGDDEDDEDDLPVVVNVEEAERARRQIAKAELRTGWAEAELDPLNGSGGGNSTLVRARHDSDNDTSPPRRIQNDNNDASLPRRRGVIRQRHDSDDDASPPRRQQLQHGSDGDASPPRRGRLPQHGSSDDASPPRRARQRHDSDGEDASPPRRTAPPAGPAGSDSDASPPRRVKAGAAALGQKRAASPGDLSPPRKKAAGDTKMMSDGLRSGMIQGKDLSEELKRKRASNLARMAELDDEATGRNAKTVHRDKSGKVVTEEELRAAREKERKDKEWKTPEWGAGVAQQRAAAERSAEMRAAASQPFARTREALDADVSFRERERWGDPMAHLARKKVADMPSAPSLNPSQMKKTGFIVPQAVPAHSWLKRNVGAPLNRYGIKPGRHWDGVDRSNGFERDMFAQQNKQASLAREARAWGQEDM